MSRQVTTVRLTPEGPGPGDEFWARGEVQIISPGSSARAAAGQTIASALTAAGVPQPTQQQTVRVNLEEVRDFSRVLRQGDRVTIANRVLGG